MEVGNGALEHPVALITADEIVAVGGGKYNTNNTNYYLYKSGSYVQWSLSPFSMDSYIYASVFSVNTTGNISYNYINNTSGAIAPVINLSYDYAVTLVGTGTIMNPYREAD